MTRITLIDDDGVTRIGWRYVRPEVPRYCARAEINVGEVAG